MADSATGQPSLKWYFDAPDWKVIADFDNAGDSTQSIISIDKDNGNIDIGIHGDGTYVNNLSIDVNAGFKFEMGDGDFDISSTTGAFFPPRMTAAQADSLTGVDGMIIFVTDTNTTFTPNGFYGYDNGWISFQ